MFMGPRGCYTQGYLVIPCAHYSSVCTHPGEMKTYVHSNARAQMSPTALLMTAKHGRDPTDHPWMNEQKVGRPHNGVLFSRKKECRPDTCHDLKEPCKHDAR